MLVRIHCKFGALKAVGQGQPIMELVVLEVTQLELLIYLPDKLST
jgi:hypothetical protein